MENSILDAINYIRNTNRKKPSISNIFKYLTKLDSNISQETIENELNILQDKGKIEQRGETVSKSFFILQRPQIFDNNEKDTDTGSVSVNEDNVNEDSSIIINEDITDHEKLLDAKPDRKADLSDLSQRLDLLFKYMDTEFQNIHNRLNSVDKSDNGDVRSSVDSEVKFLRDEIKSKNTIINILLENSLKRDRNDFVSCRKSYNSSQTKTFESSFQNPKRYVSNTKTYKNNYCPVKTSNRFEDLQNVSCNNDGDDDDDNEKNNNNRSLSRKQHKDNYNHSLDSQQHNKRVKNKSESTNTTRQTKRNHSGHTYTAIVGDSIVKDVKGWELSTENHKVVVKSFSGATTKDMSTYVKPSLERSPKNLILHSGTNDLRHVNDSMDVANAIVKLAVSMKTDDNQIIVSGLVPRGDNLNGKVVMVNNALRRECAKRNIFFIEHDNINPRLHCNRSKLHLNKEGTNIFMQNIIECLNCLD